MQTLYACPNVQDDDGRREAQPAADEGVPRARLRRGDVRARVPARRARREARPRPARAAPPQLRRRRRRATAASTAARTCSSATGAPRRTGSAATRCARARPTPSSAASASPRRSGTAAAARRATPGSASARTATRTVVTGDAGHRHRHEDGDGADRGRGARHPARPRDGRARRLRARPVRVDLGRLVDDPVDGACGARRGGRREAADPRDRGAALRPRGARRSTSRAATSSPPTATSLRRSRRSSGCSENAQILGTGARGPEPGRHDACSRSACRSPRSPSTSRRAR